MYLVTQFVVLYWLACNLVSEQDLVIQHVILLKSGGTSTTTITPLPTTWGFGASFAAVLTGQVIVSAWSSLPVEAFSSMLLVTVCILIHRGLAKQRFRGCVDQVVNNQSLKMASWMDFLDVLVLGTGVAACLEALVSTLDLYELSQWMMAIDMTVSALVGTVVLWKCHPSISIRRSGDIGNWWLTLLLGWAGSSTTLWLLHWFPLPVSALHPDLLCSTLQLLLVLWTLALLCILQICRHPQTRNLQQQRQQKEDEHQQPCCFRVAHRCACLICRCCCCAVCRRALDNGYTQVARHVTEQFDGTDPDLGNFEIGEYPPPSVPRPLVPPLEEKPDPPA